MPFLEQLFTSFLQLISALLSPVVLVPLIICGIVFVKKNKEYKKGAYYQITKQSYLSIRNDIGKYGEYYTYKCLKNFEQSGAKFLFNVYIPKENDETTEIDVLMICSKGLFVFESKNYSGWIFGSESQKNWYQTLPKGRGRSHKESFYNPIMQNRSHIKYLKALLGEQIPIRSIIVFSDRCTLKSVQVSSNDIHVINRYSVASVVSDICDRTSTDLLTQNDIAEIYNNLYPFTQVDERTKKQHISNIQNNLNHQHAQQHTVTELTERSNAAVEELTKEEIVEEPMLKCPKCNGNLILRTARRGANAGKQFYGCSNYPKCKYIQDQ